VVSANPRLYGKKENVIGGWLRRLVRRPHEICNQHKQKRKTENMNLKNELIIWLDQQTITSENIGDIRRSLFVPWSSEWNSIVRDETASRENKSPNDRGQARRDNPNA
jgi:hypothetical protein